MNVIIVLNGIPNLVKKKPFHISRRVIEEKMSGQEVIKNQKHGHDMTYM